MSFDLKVHIRNEKGVVVQVNPYRLHVSKENGRLFERPVGSGCLYTEAGELVDSPELRKQKEESSKQKRV